MYYINNKTGERAPGSYIGDDEYGDRLFSVPEGWTPEEPYWLDEEGYAHEGDAPSIQYTYSIFDCNPNEVSGSAWPTHTNLTLEADSDNDAIDQVTDIMSTEAAGLNPSDGYSPGECIHAIVWAANGGVVGQPTYELTHDDLGVEPVFYRIDYTDGRDSSDAGTFDAAIAICADYWPELVYGHDGDLSDGGDRTLVWACEADSIDDDGARAVATIRQGVRVE